MHPILFDLGPFPLYSYGALMAVAFVLGMMVALRRARWMGVDPQVVSDLALYILLGIVAGARLLHVITNWGAYQGHILDVFKVWEGGLAFHGGLIGAVTACLLYLHHRRVSPWPVGDVIIPSVALGHAIGRIGCFLNGCCFGPETDLPWAVSFPPGSLASQEQYGRDLLLSPACSSLPVHPTQLYSVLVLLLIFFVLLKLTRRARFPGEVFWSYGVLYGLARFGLEMVRGDNPRVLLGLSLFQIISLVLAAGSALMLGYLRRRAGELHGPIYPASSRSAV